MIEGLPEQCGPDRTTTRTANDLVRCDPAPDMGLRLMSVISPIPHDLAEVHPSLAPDGWSCSSQAGLPLARGEHRHRGVVTADARDPSAAAGPGAAQQN